MLSRFYPNEYCQSVFNIDYIRLREQFDTLIFDIDNTLAFYDVAEPTKELVSFFAGLSQKGFKICLLSNGREQRVKKFNEKLSLVFISHAKKPGQKGLVRALGLLAATADGAVIIGDQLFTDIWCGNRSGLHSILVRPLSDREEWFVKLKRIPEKLVLHFYRKSLEGGTNNAHSKE